MNPIAFSVFGFDIRWYSIMLLIAILVTILLVIIEGKRFNIPRDFSFNLAFWVIIFGVISARAYYCIFNYELYKDNILDIFKIWQGGLAIHGALLGGFITLVIYCRRYGMSVLKMTDITVVPLLLAQAIGRWGNFFNSEAHGPATTLLHLKSLHIPDFVIEGMKIGNVYYHPTFFYESFFCLIGFLILVVLRRYKYIKRGQLTAIYLMYYSIVRFFIESFRTDALMFAGFKVAQIISILLFIIGAVMFMIISRKGRFEDLYNEDLKGPLRF